MKIEKLLTTLYQSDQAATGTACPSAEELAAYCDNTLADKQKSLLEHHILSCQDCLAQIVLVSKPLPQSLQETTLCKSVDIIIHYIKKAVKAFPLNETIQLFPTPVLNPALRGNNISEMDQVRFRKKLKQFDLDIRVSALLQSGGTIAVDLSRQEKTMNEKIRVNLLKDNREIASFLTSNGGVVFDYSEYGTYSLLISNRNKKNETLNILIEGEK